MKSSTSSKPPKPKQAGKPRMGRPSSKEAYAAYVTQTRNLMTAIKAGSGNLSNRKIEEGLGIGRDESGEYSGRYFVRYLNSATAKNKAALPPDRLSQIAERAQALGWIPKEQKRGLFLLPDPFKHLEVADGELLSERISLIKNERVMLLKAQEDAVKALRNLAATMKSCKKVGFMHDLKSEKDECDVAFDGINVDIKDVIERISASYLFNEEFIDAGGLFG